MCSSLSGRTMEAFAWECFAGAHPHEAAEMDWPRFVAYARYRVGWEIPEVALRELLAAVPNEDAGEEPHARQ